MKVFKKHGLKIIGAVILLIFAPITIPQGRAFYKALFLAPEMIEKSPVKPLHLITRKPIVRDIRYQSQDQTISADLYLPADNKKHPAAVLDLGLNIDRKDPRVQKVAEAFSRSGLIILAPNIPSVANRRLFESTPQDFINSFLYLQTLDKIIDDKVGFIGFCTSGGLAFIAAENEQIAQNVAFVAAVNPYFDLKSLYKALTLRQINDKDWIPHFKSVEVYNRETISLLDAENDQKILKKHLVQIPPDNLAKGNFPPLTTEEKNQLSEEAKFTFAGLANKDPQKADFYLGNATSAQKEFLKKVSPATNIDKLQAKAFIFVDGNFNYIPYTEGHQLNSALSGNKHVFTETKILPTDQLAKGLSLKNYLTEGTKVVRFLYFFFLEISQ